MSKKNKKNEMEKLLQAERDKHSQELFKKNEGMLDIAEIVKLEQYMQDLANPEWRPIIIDGQESNYIVSNTGLVKNATSGLLLAYSLDGKGYAHVGLSMNNKSHTKRIHRLVAETFIPNPENKPQVNHMNGVKTCNWVGNLEWCTNSENQIHAINMGLRKILKGAEHGHCQHTEEQVHAVCRLLEQGVPVYMVARKLNVKRSFVTGIIYQGNWPDIQAQYNMPESHPHPKRDPEVIAKIDSLLDSGLRNRREIIRLAGLEYNDTNVSYVKHRIRIRHEAAVKSSTTIENASSMEEIPTIGK